MTNRLILCVILIAGWALCAAAEDAGAGLAEARSRFEAADAALNKAYKALCAGLEKEHVAALREGQRDWIHYRDEMADARSAAGAGDLPLKRRPGYWDAMAGLTEERTDFLNAYAGKNTTVGITGEYRDSYGGTLLIEERKDGIAFSIEVVRGRAQNEGALDGLAVRTGDHAVYKETPPPGDPSGPCEITFTFIDRHIIKLEEKNADKFQGHNAHFEGRYYQSGKLKEPIKLL